MALVYKILVKIRRLRLNSEAREDALIISCFFKFRDNDMTVYLIPTFFVGGISVWAGRHPA